MGKGSNEKHGDAPWNGDKSGGPGGYASPWWYAAAPKGKGGGGKNGGNRFSPFGGGTATTGKFSEAAAKDMLKIEQANAEERQRIILAQSAVPVPDLAAGQGGQQNL